MLQTEGQVQNAKVAMRACKVLNIVYKYINFLDNNIY